MAIATLELAKMHLGVTESDDDTLISAKLDSAQALLEGWLGYAIEDRFDTPPADLVEAVLQMMAHAYENREATVVGLTITAIPLGVRDVIAARRDYFTGAADGS